MRTVHMAAFWAVHACWLTLLLFFVHRGGRPREKSVQRGRGWTRGLLLQTISIGLLWWPRRPLFTPLLALGPVLEAVVALTAIALGAFSVWLMMAAKRALGRQWAYEPRLVEGHRLVREGPYRWVRHPIYSALFGLALATALAVSRWSALPPFLLLFAAGTALRVRGEERLLRNAFGAEFQAYASQVRAVIPGLL